MLESCILKVKTKGVSNEPHNEPVLSRLHSALPGPTVQHGSDKLRSGG